MKYIITLLVALLMSVASYADVVRDGDNFKIEFLQPEETSKED